MTVIRGRIPYQPSRPTDLPRFAPPAAARRADGNREPQPSPRRSADEPKTRQRRSAHEPKTRPRHGARETEARRTRDRVATEARRARDRDETWGGPGRRSLCAPSTDEPFWNPVRAVRAEESVLHSQLAEPLVPCHSGTRSFRMRRDCGRALMFAGNCCSPPTGRCLAFDLDGARYRMARLLRVDRSSEHGASHRPCGRGFARLDRLRATFADRGYKSPFSVHSGPAVSNFTLAIPCPYSLYAPWMSNYL